ncbi:MAG: hypothetical protein WA975_21685 [Mesorhizobium sp.]
MSGYEEYLQLDARLVILRGLTRQADGRLNEVLITRILDEFGYNRSREWVRTQMRKMEDVGAVRLSEAGTVLVATITRAGLDHAERRTILEGIARPSPEV